MRVGDAVFVGVPVPVWDCDVDTEGELEGLGGGPRYSCGRKQ